MEREMRKLGIDILGDAPWGTHVCQFYQTKEDLIDILAPYFKAGLENNEFCMWVTSEPLRVKDAKTSLHKMVKNLDNYIKKGQIEILDAGRWYTKSGKFEPDRVLQGWVEKENQALRRGFDGLRLTGNTFWLEKRDWRDFTDYEATVNNIIGNRRMIAICSCCLDKCGAAEVVDVINSHQFALIKREGTWQIIESTELKRAHEELRASEEKYRALVENAGQAIVVVQDGMLKFANPKTMEITGDSKEELTSGPFSDFIHPDDREMVGERHLMRLRGEEVPHIYPFRIIDRDGNVKWLELSAILMDWEGRPATLNFLTEITERRRAEQQAQEAREYAESLVETVREPLLVLDCELRVISANRSFYTTFHVRPEETVGRLLYELGNRQWDIPRLRELLEQILPRKTAFENFEVEHEFPFIGTRVMLLNAREIRREPGRKELILLAIEDVTDRKRTEAKLKKTMADLARSNRELEQFASIASHDLKEPIRMVVSYVQLLAKHYKGRLDSDADEFIAYAVDGAHRMQRLINDLLTYSRVDAKDKGFAPTDCEVVFDQCLTNLKKAIGESGAVVTHDPLPTVMADGSQMLQLFQNLIGNAIKFHGEEPPHVHVSAERIEKSKIRNAKSQIRIPKSEIKKGWVFSVRDNGIGIDPKKVERIFLIFQRLHSRTEYAGTGIGLAICKKIVERHGGQIWVDSGPGKGSTFYFTIPGKER